MTMPANACHHYTTWHYKFPQRCYVTYVNVPPLKAEPPKPVIPNPKHDPLIMEPIDIPPTEDIYPPEAIIKLQQELETLHH